MQKLTYNKDTFLSHGQSLSGALNNFKSELVPVPQCHTGGCDGCRRVHSLPTSAFEFRPAPRPGDAAVQHDSQSWRQG